MDSGRKSYFFHVVFCWEKIKQKCIPTFYKSIIFYLEFLPSKWLVWGINSLVVQWLGLCTFTSEGPVSIPGQGTKIPWAVWHGWGKKKRLISFQSTVAPENNGKILNDCKGLISTELTPRGACPGIGLFNSPGAFSKKWMSWKVSHPSYWVSGIAYHLKRTGKMLLATNLQWKAIGNGLKMKSILDIFGSISAPSTIFSFMVKTYVKCPYSFIFGNFCLVYQLSHTMRAGSRWWAPNCCKKWHQAYEVRGRRRMSWKRGSKVVLIRSTTH